MRGGPEKWEVTGWLQIIDLQKEHEGDYTCVAQNEHGVDKATARVNVVDTDGQSVICSDIQWCKQNQILKNKTKIRPRSAEINKGTRRIYLLNLSKWTPLLISTVVMFQAQNRETIKKYLKSFCVLQGHYDDERNKTVLHNATSDLQDQDQFFGLRPVLS